MRQRKSVHLHVGVWWTDGKRNVMVVGGADGDSVQARIDGHTFAEWDERYFLRRFRPILKESAER